MLSSLRGVGMGAEHVNSRRPEEASLRIDKPPLALVLRDSEIAGRFQLGSILPPAETIPFRRNGSLLKLGKFLFMILLEILVGMNLFRPFAMLVLPVGVNERHILVCRNFLCGFRFPLQTEIRETAVCQIFLSRLIRPDHFEFDGIDFVGVQRILQVARILADFKNGFVRQIHAHGALLAGIQTDSGIGFAEIFLLAAAAGNVHGQTHLIRLGKILHIDGKNFSFGKIQILLAFHRVDLDAGIPFGGIGPEDQVLSLPCDFRLVARLALLFREGQLRTGKRKQNGHCR